MNTRKLIEALALVVAAGAVVLDFAGCGGGAPDACMPEDRASNNNLCRVLVGQCPHRGGDVIHDTCADALPRPGNVAWDGMFLDNTKIPPLDNPPKGRASQGCDVSLNKREFDALSWDGQMQNPRVWEVKTWTWSSYDDHAKQCKLKEAAAQYIADCNIVLDCNKGINDPAAKLKYTFAVSDQPLFSALNDYLVKHPEMLRDGALDFCTTQDAQGCRF